MHRSHLPWRLSVAAAFVVTFLVAGGAAAGHSVNVALQTSWNSAPFLVELLETAAAENPSSYFPLLDRIAQGTFADVSTERELYNKFVSVLDQDGLLPDAEALSSFKFALSLHEAAPRIQAHLQHYNTSVQPNMMAAQDAVCPVWVHFDGQQYCSPTLDRAQQPVDLAYGDDTLPFDRVLGPADAPSSIIYADITHPLFADFHSVVSQTAREGKTSYRVRYRATDQATSPVTLSGYGAELNLKRTDYIVIDDREASTKGNGDAADVKEPELDDELEIKSLTTTELWNLGLNAASWIAKHADPMQALLQVSTDFPRYSSFLAAQNASDDFVSEHRHNRELLLPAGYNALWINGLQIDPREINAYSLLDHLRRERKLIARVKDIGLTATEAVSILANDAIANSARNAVDQRFNWRDSDEGGEVIIFLNDLEKDSRYAAWPTSLMTLFQPQYQRGLPNVARDIHNLVVPIEVEKLSEIELVVTTLQMLVKRKLPLRVGLVPVGKSPISDTYSRLMYHLLDTYGLSTLLNFYGAIVKSGKVIPSPDKQFASAIKDRKLRAGKTAATYAEVTADDELTQRLTSRDAYADRLELNGPMPPFMLNGAVSPRTESWFETINSQIYMDTQMVMQSLYVGTLTDESVVRDFFLTDAAAKRNGLVIPHDEKDIRVVDVAAMTTEHAAVFDSLPRLPGAESALITDRAHLMVVADLDSNQGKSLLGAAMDLQEQVPEVDVLMVQNPGSESTATVSSLLYRWQSQTGPALDAEKKTKLRAFLAATGVTGSSAEDLRRDSSIYWSTAEPLIADLGLKPGDSALLLDYERTSRIAPATAAITALKLEEKFQNALDIAKITATVARSQKSELPEGMRGTAPMLRLDRYNLWDDTHTVVRAGTSKDPTIQVVAVLDPVAEASQPWISIVKTLSELEGVSVKIFLNPKEQLSELPSKRFYRQVVQSAPTFDDAGSLAAPEANFNKLPEDVLFNLGLTVPPSWLVSPKQSVADLDNIKFGVSDSDVGAVYELEHILIEGHARDSNVSSPPRGVQLLLGTEQDAHFTDTIIMANLGYFQFKANPGHWSISLMPGRSSKIYNLDSAGAEGYLPVPGDDNSAVTLMSFQGVTLYPRLSRREGQETADVLETSTLGSATDYLSKGASWASSALSSLGLKPSGGQAEINIFSVASGHLYERMLNIMMVSVMKHTKHTVKFWFIEQFLSPSFKATLPALAAHYNFDYEMVTYKWPHWLRGQKEKQREIWGYKILFLDVLFPLQLSKVIFVDADQIVRTDMMELNKVDLQGAPYGFTPMCDSRTEMEGFRFWKKGYWESYLAGKPYHISALYVVDLKKFRELAAGDRLRQQYHSLSADPESLSNLDQDLPNHMQHNLPIFSLPQEWLWCETWCSDESLGQAKTIDLCNNPLTKEPKLDRARRQVPEWNEYDEEIRGVIAKARGDLPDSAPSDKAEAAKERLEDFLEQEEGQKSLKKDEL
ncbi:UDP-glucose:glycoprotein glucosyltransferase [Cyphellophora attinorum]|uniref:UDP-glucose:glycoprotein glucosyltransferase n=1 Tax=Cyphellophora attinorum TaxID=1664694 RepID=A0A0N0NHZ2_9EURO|nr:UDP-glucose:glycoprotein glucosyltransferase [Phialophora attinorum]KPI35241.1 UDP-glucose:glycoprotein glucosyltransferase [Phialophora attinorum]